MMFWQIKFPLNAFVHLLICTCVNKVFFLGYNVTILAYGQTGSGKTYTMGTNYSGSDGDFTRLGMLLLLYLLSYFLSYLALFGLLNSNSCIFFAVKYYLNIICTL